MSNEMYDLLVVGAGLYGATMANLAKRNGKSVLVIDKNSFIGGNCATDIFDNIVIHKFGAHIFHTSNKEIWDYVNSFTRFNNYINEPIAYYKGEIYNLPFNMNTFTKLWKDVLTPEEAKKKIEKQRTHYENPKNLEEQALNLVGKDIYRKLIKGYTEKQWGRSCKDLSPDIIKRLPLRYTFDNNYFNDKYQGIPDKGYTELIKQMLNGIYIWLNTKFNKENHLNIAKKIIYTGSIDEYYDYMFGKLEYRSVELDIRRLEQQSFVGNAVINFTSKQEKFTRLIEHKFFNKNSDNINDNITYISYEYPVEYNGKNNPCYPINDTKNNELYSKYLEYSKNDNKVFFGGRLGNYEYLDMDKVIEKAFGDYNELFG